MEIEEEDIRQEPIALDLVGIGNALMAIALALDERNHIEREKLDKMFPIKPEREAVIGKAKYDVTKRKASAPTPEEKKQEDDISEFLGPREEAYFRQHPEERSGPPPLRRVPRIPEKRSDNL